MCRTPNSFEHTVGASEATACDTVETGDVSTPSTFRCASIYALNAIFKPRQRFARGGDNGHSMVPFSSSVRY